MIDHSFATRRIDAISGSERLRNAILLAKGLPIPETATRIRARYVPPVTSDDSRCTACGRFKTPLAGKIARIQEVVAAHFGVPLGHMASDRRAREIAHPRQVAMYLAAETTTQSLIAIGKRFNRDHTTVIHAIRAVKQRLIDEPGLAADVAEIRERLAA
jgi:hypothetical protein